MRKQYRYDDIEALQEIVTEDFGPWSESLEISQSMIDTFADLTGDHNWIHTDVGRCETESPFGSTIAHGFLSLVMIPRILPPKDYDIVGYSSAINGGSDRLRFTAPVPVGSKIHARSRVTAVAGSDKGTRVEGETHIHVVGSERPSVVYGMVYRYL